MEKCDCYRIGKRIKYNNIFNKSYADEYFYCMGTKELDECSCEGDRTKCDFYPKVREKALNEQEVLNLQTVPIENYLKLKNKNKKLRNQINRLKRELSSAVSTICYRCEVDYMNDEGTMLCDECPWKEYKEENYHGA